jgi:hypothetical protein
MPIARRTSFQKENSYIFILFFVGTARSLKSKVKRLKEERDAGNGSTEETGGENRVSGEASGRSCKAAADPASLLPGQSPGLPAGRIVYFYCISMCI